jgi:hypothetical protein
VVVATSGVGVTDLRERERERNGAWTVVNRNQGPVTPHHASQSHERSAYYPYRSTAKWTQNEEVVLVLTLQFWNHWKYLIRIRIRWRSIFVKILSCKRKFVWHQTRYGLDDRAGTGISLLATAVPRPDTGPIRFPLQRVTDR